MKEKYSVQCRSNVDGRNVTRVAWLMVVFLTLASFFGGTGSRAADRKQDFLPLSEVKPGLKGIGRTVFHGDKVEEFQVEILGVLENIAPKQSAILAKLSGGPLENTGVMGDMTGSPVYVDGKMVGAVAFSFPFSKEAIAGITPIQQMVDIFDKSEEPIRVDPIRIEVSSVKPHRTLEFRPATELLGLSNIGSKTFSVSESLATTIPSLQPLTGQLFNYIDTPIVLSGFNSKAAQLFGNALRPLGMTVIQSGGIAAGSGSDKLADGADLLPGSA